MRGGARRHSTSRSASRGGPSTTLAWQTQAIVLCFVVQQQPPETPSTGSPPRPSIGAIDAMRAQEGRPLWPRGGPWRREAHTPTSGSVLGPRPSSPPSTSSPPSSPSISDRCSASLSTLGSRSPAYRRSRPLALPLQRVHQPLLRLRGAAPRLQAR